MSGGNQGRIQKAGEPWCWQNLFIHKTFLVTNWEDLLAGAQKQTSKSRGIELSRTTWMLVVEIGTVWLVLLVCGASVGGHIWWLKMMTCMLATSLSVGMRMVRTIYMHQLALLPRQYHARASWAAHFLITQECGMCGTSLIYKIAAAVSDDMASWQHPLHAMTKKHDVYT